MEANQDFLMQDCLQVIEKSNTAITVNGDFVILSGGESASQGGMGSGSKSGTEKGEIKTGSDNEADQKNDSDIESENTFDPLKKEIEKEESKNN